MKITTNKNALTGEVSYTIKIKLSDDIDAEELAKSFKEQYPKEAAVISFAKVTALEIGIIIVGLKLGVQK